jgi:hypothetical protein
MVDAGNTPKHELRSQIAFIQREVAALEANHLATIDDHANLQEAHTKLKESEAKRKNDGWKAMGKEAEQLRRANNEQTSLPSYDK